jgi:hypothetical protein
MLVAPPTLHLAAGDRSARVLEPSGYRDAAFAQADYIVHGGDAAATAFDAEQAGDDEEPRER